MKSPVTNRQLLAIVDGLASQGARVRETKVAWFIIYPNGEGGPIHKTVSDIRGLRNKRAEVRRAGLVWPLDPEFRNMAHAG